MGMFSYMCGLSGNQIRSDVCAANPKNNIVRLYFLKDGKVLEEMRGQYNGYGSVELKDRREHFLFDTEGNRTSILEDIKSDECSESTFSGDDWKNGIEWGDMIHIHFNDDAKSGFAAVLEMYVPTDDWLPTHRSDDDPNQGWPAEE